MTYHLYTEYVEIFFAFKFRILKDQKFLPKPCLNSLFEHAASAPKQDRFRERNPPHETPIDFFAMPRTVRLCEFGLSEAQGGTQRRIVGGSAGAKSMRSGLTDSPLVPSGKDEEAPETREGPADLRSAEQVKRLWREPARRDRFGKVAASHNSNNLTLRSMESIAEICRQDSWIDFLDLLEICPSDPKRRIRHWMGQERAQRTAG